MQATVLDRSLGVADPGFSSPGIAAPETLITIPAFNEKPFLARSLSEVDAALARTGISYRLSVAEDGSDDGTKELLKFLAERNPELIVQSESVRRGRGRALRELWSGIDADVYAFVDADLAASPTYLVSAIKAVQAGSPLVVGSRYVPGSVVDRPPLRNIVSLSYNWLVREMFDEPIRDHQCGLKVFSRDALRRLLPLTSSDSWFWDTEVLVVASRIGVPVKELPIYWKERRTRRTPITRLLSDFRVHGQGLLRLRAELDTRVNSGFEGIGVARSSLT